MNETAHVIEIALVRAVQHRHGAEEQETLEQGVVEHMIERGDQTEHAEHRMIGTEKYHR